MAYGINPPFNGVDPMTGKYYVAGQQVPIRKSGGQPYSVGSGRPAKNAVPKPPASGRANTAWNIPRGEMDEILKQYQDEVLAAVPDVGGYTPDELLTMLGLGSTPTSTGGGGGGRRGGGMVAPRWSQADVDALRTATQGTSAAIGQGWDAATAQLQKLMADYATADAARRAGAQQMLGAFGAPTQLDIGGVGAGDVLSALLGQAAVNKTLDQNELANLLNSYSALVGTVK